MKNTRTSDLASEQFGISASATSPFGGAREYSSRGFSVTRLCCRDGCYHTVSCGQIWLETTERRQQLCRLIGEIIDKYKNGRQGITLTVGLGSSSVTSDSLGALTADRVIITDQHMLQGRRAKMCAIKPGVPGRTGIDTAAAVRAIAEQTKAELIITVDSLSAISPERLCTVVQITDCGITPGSALSHSSGEISKRTMPCPVISIGVPTVIRADLLSGKQEDNGLLVSPADADIAISCYASVIAGGINLAHMGNKPRQVIGGGGIE